LTFSRARILADRAPGMLAAANCPALADIVGLATKRDFHEGSPRMDEIFRRPLPPVPFPFTGERLTTAVAGEIESEHLHRYLYARELCRGKDVLDVACGEGYGSALLSQVARSVLGIDSAQGVIEHARRSYTAANLRFSCGDARCIEAETASVDVVVSFETLEHLAEQDTFLKELRRVLRPEGVVMISTPDRDNYINPEPNPYHLRELTRSEFASLLSRYFENVFLLVQHPVVGSALAPVENAGTGLLPLCFTKAEREKLEASQGIPRPRYILALASAGKLPAFPLSIYFDERSAPPDEREMLLHEQENLRQQLVSCRGVIAQKEREIAAVYASSSWRVTRPWRAARQLLAKWVK
jgi:SAM-dependent methyltransferase